MVCVDSEAGLGALSNSNKWRWCMWTVRRVSALCADDLTARPRDTRPDVDARYIRAIWYDCLREQTSSLMQTVERRLTVMSLRLTT